MENLVLKIRKLSCIALIFMIGMFDAVLHGSVAYDAGKARIFEVMYKGPGGIEKINKQVAFVGTKNLSEDLNLQEISNRIGCQTELGKAFLKKRLENPISPYDQSFTIEHSQKLIRLLVQEPQVLAELEALIVQAVEHELVVMKFMQNRSIVSSVDNPIAAFFQFMDRNKYFQTYSKYMQTNSFLRGNLPSIWQDGRKAWNSIFQDISLSQRFLLIGSGLLGLSGEQLADDHRFMMSLWSTALTGYSLYTHYTGALATRNALYSLYQLIDIAKNIEDLCYTYNVEHQFKLSSIRSEEGIKLVDDLNQSRYKEKDSNFILSPIINTFMYEVYEHDENLAPVYASIAEIDAYVTLAKKMIASQNDDHKFCFVQFLDHEKPMMLAQGFWNILVSNGNIVVNDISESRNIILTGANEGGKTTTIRAILQNIVLAQTFGIAAATEFKLTPYTMIHSYLNVADDILTGKSRYAFELQQAKSIINQIENLQPGQKFFFVLDELFTGTNGEDGAQAAYDYIDNIASFAGIQFIYATHFNKLKTIGAANSACINYKIDPPLRDEKGQFIRNDKGEFIYPYKLSLGANNVNVALERARDAGLFKKKVQTVA